MTAVIVPPVSAVTPVGTGQPLLRVRGLEKAYRVNNRPLRAVDGVDLDVGRAEIHALVGESGSGKTTLARCILRLVDPSAGAVELDGVDVLAARGSGLRAIRRQMQVVFQDPVGSLDPRLSVRDQVAEPIRLHLGLPRGQVEPTVLGLLEEVGLARRHLDRRPHEMSGGQCQRVAIARAIAVRPRLLVLDEPTSALDVSVQAQILNLLVDLRERHGLSYLLISHDLGVVRHVSDRVSVMYLGRIVELGATDGLFETGSHPYTRALLAAVPDLASAPGPSLIRGEPPLPSDPPAGCRFHPRCWLREQLPAELAARCVAAEPPRVDATGGAACHYPELVAPEAIAVVAAFEAPAPDRSAASGLPASDASSPAGITLATWQDPQNLAWSYVHADAVLATAAIGAAGATASPLPEERRDIGAWTFPVRGEDHTVDEMVDATDTDGFLFLHDGRVVDERYARETSPRSAHLLQSVSKSVTSGLAGALVGRRLLDPADLVTRHVPELAGTSFDACTIEHLLDMRAGTRFSEVYEDLDSDIRVLEQVVNWRPTTRPGLPVDLLRYAATLGNQAPHGSAFEYRSVLTDVLGLALERAGGATFARLLGDLVWGPMGAEFAATITVDASGAPIADGGLSVALRDLARFGQLYLDDGLADGRRVLPGEWVARVGVPRPDLVAAFGPSLTYDGVATATSHYHDQWWVFDADRGIFGAIGIHGQALVVHRPGRVVVAKMSTHPAALDRRKHELQLAGAIAIGDRLAREG